MSCPHTNIQTDEKSRRRIRITSTGQELYAWDAICKACGHPLLVGQGRGPEGITVWKPTSEDDEQLEGSFEIETKGRPLVSEDIE